MSPTRNETLEFVTKAHAGQVDKAGEPYTGHLVRVENYAVEIGHEAGLDALTIDRVQKVALMHDLIEDTEHEDEDLRKRGYEEADVKSVKLLTKDPKSKLPYAQVIQGIADSGDVVAIVVKLGDNKDNGDERRLAQLPEDKAARLRKKYVPARTVLREALAKLVAVPETKITLPSAPEGRHHQDRVGNHVPVIAFRERLERAARRESRVP